MENVAARYWEDKLFRLARIDSGNDIDDVLVELDVDLPPGVAARLVANTSDTYHVVFPPDPNVDLSDESLSMVAGGKVGRDCRECRVCVHTWQRLRHSRNFCDRVFRRLCQQRGVIEPKQSRRHSVSKRS